MSSKHQRPVVFRVLLAFSLVAGLLALEAVPASASGANVDLSVSLSADGSGDATAGQPWAYTITVANGAAADDSTGYTVSVDVPSGTTPGFMDGACQENSGTIDCTSVGLTAGSSEDFHFQLNIGSDYADGTSLQATATLSDINGDSDTSSSDDSSTVNTTVQRVADLGIVKSGPGGVLPIVVAGDPAGYDYTLTVSTSGPSDADYTVDDTLANGLTFQTSGSDPSCSAVGQDVTCSGSIAATADPTGYTIHVLVDPSVGDASILDNDATVNVASDGTEDPNSSNNTTTDGGTVHTDITAQADLGISVDATNGDQIAGDPAGVDYTYTVSTSGPSDNVGGFTISDTLPSGFTYAAAGSDAACSASSGSTISCTDNTNFLHNDADRTFTIHAKIASSVLVGSYADAASVASNGTTDPNGLNDTANDSVSVINEADLTPTVTFGSGPFTAGGSSFNGTVKVDNNGYSDNHGGYSVNVPLPTGIAFVSGGAGCSAVTGGFTCQSTSDLAAGANRSRSVTLRAKSSAAASPPSYTLTGTVSSLGTDDPTSANNTSTDTFTVITRADLSLTTAAITYPSGQTAAFANTNSAQNFAIYEYNVANNGPSDAQNVSFSDTLPSGVTFVGACFGTATCTPNQTLPLSIGTLNGNDGSPTNQSKHIRVKVSANASLRNGPISLTDSAQVGSDTQDPGPSLNTRSETATAWTVTSTPPNLFAAPGNTNAFFKWGPPTNFGGVPGGTGSILDFRVRVYLSPTATTPIERTLTVAPDNCGTPGNTFYCVLIGTAPNGPALTNGTTYYFTVEARNVVGLSDPNSTRPSVTPTIDASAQQINNTNLSQHTGNSSLPTSADKQISFQNFPSNTTGVGTILETNQGTALFCGGPCRGQIVQTKLQDPSLPGIYQITLLYDKTLIAGTGQKYKFYYAPTATATTGTALNVCPKTITAAVVPCVVTKLASGGANPALKAVIYTKDADPTIGGRGFPK